MWILAWRGLFGFKTRTWLTIFGVAVGVFCFTTMGAMALHFHVLAKRFENYVSGKLFIRERSGFFGAGALDESELLSLSKQKGIGQVIPVMVSRLRTNEFFVLGLPQMAIGIPLSKIPLLFKETTLAKGHWPINDNQCVLGADIAQQNGSKSTFTYLGKVFEVIGVIARTDGPEDHEMVVSSNILEKLLGRSGLVSLGIVLPQDVAAMKTMGERIEAQHSNWQVLTPTLLANQIRRNESLWNALTLGVALLAVLVGGVGILTVMMMGIAERIKEIAISKALGAGQEQIFWIFFFESFVLAILGTFTGLALGCFAISIANHFLEKQGIVLFQTTPMLFASNALLAIFLSLIGGLYPAWHGSKMNLASSLRR